MPPRTLIVAPASVDPRQAAINNATANGIWLKPSSMPSAVGDETKLMITPSSRVEISTPPTARVRPYSRKPRIERSSVRSPA